VVQIGLYYYQQRQMAIIKQFVFDTSQSKHQLLPNHLLNINDIINSFNLFIISILIDPLRRPKAFQNPLNFEYLSKQYLLKLLSQPSPYRIASDPLFKWFML
jgi:hypothetical protein